MYITSIECTRSGRIVGPMVVSMRPIPRRSLALVRRICSAYPGAHGAPLEVDGPRELGINDLGRPDFGDPVPVGADEEPTFWACGVTPQVVLDRSGCPSFAMHQPGRMFISDAPETITPLSVAAASDRVAPGSTRRGD